ncbi:MAG: hypothetical protein FWC10_00720 [Lentimicrobiaceae bacterium]|nr:hypothetical protein [Lentimicrobiaceae bacterium]
MKRESLLKFNAKSRGALLLVLSLCVFPELLSAQPDEYKSSKGIVVGTSDARLTASIYETDTTVTMKIMAIGYMQVDYINFPIYYDPNLLSLCKSTGEEVSAFGYLYNDLGTNVVTLNDELKQKGWLCFVTHKNKGIIPTIPTLSGHASMRVVDVDMVSPLPLVETTVLLNEGEVKTIAECYFIKKIAGQELANSNVGIGVKTNIPLYQPRFGYDGLFLWYKELIDPASSNDFRITNSNLFLLRSGSSVITYPANNVAINSATLKGYFQQGAQNLPVSSTILDTIGTATSGKGRLNHDEVKKYGFIFSLNDVQVYTSEFNDSIIINNIHYPVPTNGEVASGTFTRGAYTFNIVIVDNNGGTNEKLNYSAPLTNLLANTTYYAWAYTHYTFETSKEFQLVGERIDFKTKDCLVLNIETIYINKEPDCGKSNGEVQVYVAGGSGEYEFSVNGGIFKQYNNDLITSLAAGVYTISVRDAQYPDCPTTSVENIVLHNGDTDLSVNLTAQDALTCVSTDGKLFIAVTGGTPNYTYYLNDEELNETPNIIENIGAGAYTITVMDAKGCVATSGTVHINAATPSFTVNIEVTHEASCGANTGEATVTVTGSSDYTYQLNANPPHHGTKSEIVLTGLSAGVYKIRIEDSCSVVTQTFEVTNGTHELSFAMTSQKELLSCDGQLIPGSITISVTHGKENYAYSIDGINWVEFTGATANISGLHQGIYTVRVQDDEKCTYEINNITLSREIITSMQITAPVAATPQTFCGGATVANLQAIGLNIKWYLTAVGGSPLDMSTPLDSGKIYYAVQSIGNCESQERTDVKVYIDDNVVLQTPVITTPQDFCNPSTNLSLADIATNGNTNIVWYDVPQAGTPLPLNTPLEAKTYYAVIKAGYCESSPKVPVEITFGNSNPVAPVVITPQYFCEGALIANIAVPNNKIVWYLKATGGEPLSTAFVLQDGATYYAAQTAGACESATRTAVTVHITEPLAPLAVDTQAICGKATIADIVITGCGIRWYDAATVGNLLPLSTSLEAGKSYWAAQSSGNCEGARIKITVTNNCYTVYGTMFPFVNTENVGFDSQYPVTVRLLPVPPKDGNDPVYAIQTATPIQVTKAVNYNGTIYVPGTPKNPGVIGNTNNPGIKISWEELGKTVSAVDNTTVVLGEIPITPIGLFMFTNIVPGEYILEISRQGFITRRGQVTVNMNGISLGHRELIAGDVNNDLIIDGSDISSFNSKYTDETSSGFAPQFDLNGDGNENIGDRHIIIDNVNATMSTYLETFKWIMSYYE